MPPPWRLLVPPAYEVAFQGWSDIPELVGLRGRLEEGAQEVTRGRRSREPDKDGCFSYSGDLGI